MIALLGWSAVATAQPEDKRTFFTFSRPVKVLGTTLPLGKGDPIGREFIYPKQEAQLLAKSSSQPVLTTKADSTTVEQTKSGDLSRVSANGQETNVKPATSPRHQCRQVW